MIYQSPKSSISDSDISFQFSKSGGPGGQHVNRVETAVLLSFDIRGSSLAPSVQNRLIALAGHQLVGDSILQISSREHRSQIKNRIAAVERLVELVKEAEKEPLKRKKTKIGRAAKEKRLRSKKQHKQKKESRRSVNYDI